jgi:hypothetical protein
VLFCNVKTDGCVTPKENKNYLLFDGKTRWKMPGATDFITLSFVQEMTVTYNKGENIGLVPQDVDGDFGMFVLDPWGGGYERDTIATDGPIIYGTGMNDQDRQNAWQHFFLLMVTTAIKQQGEDAIKVKLARRCLPGQNVCMMTLDAMLVGVAGSQEPRKVAVFLATDVHDQNKQMLRMVCTWPSKGKKVCRDFNSGKLIPDNQGQ